MSNMKKKKGLFKNILINFTLLLCLFAFLTINRVLGSESKRDLMYYGLEKINRKTFELYDMKKLRFEKLRKDLDQARQSSMNHVSKDSDFYLLKPTPFTVEELDSALIGTGLEGLGKDFKEAEEKFGVNAILLMAMAKHETGNGTSELFKDKNNLFGFNAYDDDPYNKATHFNSPGESINTVADHLKKEYLAKDGDYYKGVSPDAIGKSYATDPDWASKVSYMMEEVASNMISEYERLK